MKGQRPITVKKLFEAKACDANGNVTTKSVDLEGLAQDGMFSIQIDFVTTSGTSTVKVEYLVSLDGVNFVDPTGASDIVSSLSITSSATKQVYSFEPELAKHMQIKITESNNNAFTITTLHLATQ